MKFNWHDLFGSWTGELHSLHDLFVVELRDIYNAEKQILTALPKMASAASSAELKKAFQQHEQQTRTHVQRLDRIFGMLNVSSSGETCEAMEGLVSEGKELLGYKADAEVMDAGLIAAAQKVEHYEMATYGSLRTWAQQMGRDDIANLLQQTLNEEGETDKKLTRIAENIVNLQAAHH
jgi:ferritin-like metal-binding protein YciE